MLKDNIPVHDPVSDISNIKSDLLKVFDKIDGLEQKIINVDAKYKIKSLDRMISIDKVYEIIDKVFNHMPHKEKENENM
tara:strand:- start:93 stop:329 length:237 start_codon:yes stop_codon:yes gene_type:complete